MDSDERDTCYGLRITENEKFLGQILASKRSKFNLYFEL